MQSALKVMPVLSFTRRSSKTPETQQALSNEYLKKAGLYSLGEGWIAVHYSNQKTVLAF